MVVNTVRLVDSQFIKIRADQNTGGTLLESSMRIAMHGKSRVSSAMSVELNCLQYLFYTIIKKISDSFRICDGSPVC